MDKKTKEILKVFVIIAAVLVSIPLLIVCFVLFMNWTDTWDRDCEKGPLAEITDCEYDQSAESWMNSGFWTSDAKGKLNGLSCDIVLGGEEKLPFTEMIGKKSNQTAIYKVSCENFGQGISGSCYAAQRASVNGNTRYVKIMITDGCDNVRYFEGSKYTIQDGKPVFYDWINPIPNIPDEKTGKVEPIQVYGEIPNKTGLYRRG